MGATWSVNRDSAQWKAIAEQRIYAMSSACDKKEFNPPTRSMPDTLVSQLIHLAETHDQIAEDFTTSAVSKFERFVKSLKPKMVSFEEFRHSDCFDQFNDDVHNSPKMTQKQSTPVLDEFQDDYTEDELKIKKPRYH